MKKSISIILAVLLLLSVIPLTASAATIVDSGTCGENLTWALDDNGTLFISGTGAMYDYDYFNLDNTVPWNNIRLSIKAVKFSDGVTHIGNYAFFGYKNLNSVDFSKDTISIGDYAFDYCHSLKSINLPVKLKIIGDLAFAACGLTSIILPEGLTDIGMAAFCESENLESIYIPASVTNIGLGVFNCCYNLKYVTVNTNNKFFTNDEYGVLFNKDKTRLLHYALGNGRTSYAIPDGVTSIAAWAFFDCGLESIGIPLSLSSIEEVAFCECDTLKDVYYIGTSEQWQKISINRENNYLTDANIHFNHNLHTYNTVTTPATHLVDGIITYTCNCGDTYTESITKTTEHTYNTIVTAPTCENQGFTTYTCACGDSYVADYTATVAHRDADGDYYCDWCYELMKAEDNDSDNENNCSHMCHQSGFTGFIWKIVQFFWKLFKMNPVCECGAAHY